MGKGKLGGSHREGAAYRGGHAVWHWGARGWVEQGVGSGSLPPASTFSATEVVVVGGEFKITV